MFGLIKLIFKGGVLVVLAAAALGGYGYYRYAVSRLPEEKGAVICGGLCRSTPSLSGGTLPITFEAYRKSKGHNWLDSGGAGLVAARFEWNHGSFSWALDRAFEERQRSAVAERKKLAAREVEALIADLTSEDAIRREISAKELTLRTGETLGYRYDAPRAERASAAEEWKKWWANDANRVKYGARRAVSAGEKVLDMLRQAVGGGEETAPTSGGEGSR